MPKRFRVCTCGRSKRWRWPLKRRIRPRASTCSACGFTPWHWRKELGLSEDETEALRAASVLHDIGKLAVPEHIISKPGKLTPEEFEKRKSIPIVGAEILEHAISRIRWCRSCARITRNGMAADIPRDCGEAIPIGARILAAVDCLDALASDRQYRKALPLDEAMAKVAAEAGTSFDPRVVEILKRRYVGLEKLAREQPVQAPPKLSTDIRVERGLAPDAGFAQPQRNARRIPRATGIFRARILRRGNRSQIAENHDEIITA